MPQQKPSLAAAAKRRLATQVIEAAIVQQGLDPAIIKPEQIEAALDVDPDLANEVANFATELMFAKIPVDAKPN